MKVIVAGLSKTGTKSMQAALLRLGYNVYDYLENYQYLGREWEKICLEGGTTEDFRQMFENVDAVTDIPGCYFWDEIHKAFPDAKIILTMRDNEDDWCESARKQLASQSPLYLLTYFSTTMNNLYKFTLMLTNTIYGDSGTYHLFRPAHINTLLLRMTYRRHNSHVIQTAPKDKLLVYNVKEGWGPLCRFLENPVPDSPFPHENVGGDIVKQALFKEPLLIRSLIEVLFSIVFILLFLICVFDLLSGKFYISGLLESTYNYPPTRHGSEL